MTHLAQSQSLVLRRLNREDLPLFQGYRTDPEVGRFQSWSRQSDDEALHFLIAMESDRLLSPGEWSQIAIADAQTNALMGDMGLFLSADTSFVEIGITLARQWQGQGHATQAMRLAMDLIWKTTPAKSIRAWGDQLNTASIALMRRIGMAHLGTEENDVIEEAFILHRPKGS